MRIATLFASCLLPVAAQVVQRGQIALRVEPACALTEVSTSVISRARDGVSTVITGSTRFNYRLRTGRQGGSAEIVQVFDAPQGGGPAEITYTVSPLQGATLGSSKAIAVGAAALVAQFGADAHTARSGVPGEILWTWRASNAAVAESPKPILSISCR
jgi:hypothetical protein